MDESTEMVDTRAMLLERIEENPGIRYRELLRTTRLVNGVLSYHLSALEKSDVIKVDRQPRTTRYYPVTVSDKEYNILKFVRQEPVRKIILILLERELCKFIEIVDYMQMAPSTVSLYLRRLREWGMISIRYCEYQLYSLTNKDIVLEILSKYKARFTKRVVDNYEEKMEEIK